MDDDKEPLLYYTMDEVLNLVIYFDIRIKESGSFNTREIQ